MKRLFALSAALLALFFFAPAQAEAGYRSMVVGHCQSCNKPIYAYYQPVRYSNGVVQWVWKTASHTACANRYATRKTTPRYYQNKAVKRVPYATRYPVTRRPSISIRYGGVRRIR